MRTVIWDLDGTIVNSVPLHYDAFADAFRTYDGSFVLEKRQYLEFILGDLSNENFFKQQLPKISDRKAAELAEKKECAFWNLMHDRRCEPLPGAIGLIQRLSDKGLDQFLVSATPRRSVEYMVSSLGLSDYLTMLETLSGSKASTFRRIIADKDPATVVAVDDLPSGIRAARHSGIHAIGVLAGMFWAGGEATSRVRAGLKKGRCSRIPTFGRHFSAQALL